MKKFLSNLQRRIQSDFDESFLFESKRLSEEMVNTMYFSFCKFFLQKSSRSFAIGFLFFYLFNGCYQKNTDADFYEFEDANTKLIVAYQAKDVLCNTSRRVTAFVPGRARKKDIDLCVSAVFAVSCESWSSTSADATPATCKAIEFRY